jgi:hypothetical protein
VVHGTPYAPGEHINKYILGFVDRLTQLLRYHSGTDQLQSNQTFKMKLTVLHRYLFTSINYRAAGG